MKVKDYHLVRHPDGSRDVILTGDGQQETIHFPKGEEMDFMATHQQVHYEKPIYYRDGLLTTEAEPVGEGE